MTQSFLVALPNLRQILKFLSTDTEILVANTLVSSSHDYFHSLLYGVSKSNITKLQKLQNAIWRIVFRLDRMSHVTPLPA